MLWTTVRWNLANALGIAAFCLLPVIGIANGGLDHKASTGLTPLAQLQSGNFTIGPSAADECSADADATNRRDPV